MNNAANTEIVSLLKVSYIITMINIDRFCINVHIIPYGLTCPPVDVPPALAPGNVVPLRMAVAFKLTAYLVPVDPAPAPVPLNVAVVFKEVQSRCNGQTIIWVLPFAFV